MEINKRPKQRVTETWLSSDSQGMGRGGADWVDGGLGGRPCSQTNSVERDALMKIEYSSHGGKARPGLWTAKQQRCQHSHAAFRRVPRRGSRAPREGWGHAPQTLAGIRGTRGHSRGQNVGPESEDRPQAEGAERGGGGHLPHALLTGAASPAASWSRRLGSTPKVVS